MEVKLVSSSMTSPATKSRRQQAQGPHSRLPAWARYLLSIAFGAILGAFAVQWFAEIVPGPHLDVDVRTSKPQKGNGVGCTFYWLVVTHKQAIDYAYLKIQLPNRISGYKIGYVGEAHFPDEGSVQWQGFELGRNSGGECDVIQAAVNNTIDIQSSVDGNIIVIHISKLSPHSAIVGLLATPDYSSSLSPSQKYFEGAYEYTILGQRVLRVVQFRDLGLKDTK